MNIFDCFLYNGEEKMLNFRLHELDQYVDFFIIVESTHTFKGDKKPLKFDKSKFTKFTSKIIYKICDSVPYANAWQNETIQRNFLKEGFRGIDLKHSDVIMLSDVDEIPDIYTVSNLKVNNFSSITTSYHNMYYYNIDCMHVEKWPGTVIMSAGLFYSDKKFNFDLVRNTRHTYPLISSPGDYNSGGWHFSYFGDIDYIVNKIQSFSHQEYNNAKYTDPKVIEQLIKDKKDLFFRENVKFANFNCSYLPKFIDLLK